MRLTTLSLYISLCFFTSHCKTTESTSTAQDLTSTPPLETYLVVRDADYSDALAKDLRRVTQTTTEYYRKHIKMGAVLEIREGQVVSPEDSEGGPIFKAALAVNPETVVSQEKNILMKSDNIIAFDIYHRDHPLSAADQITKNSKLTLVYVTEEKVTPVGSLNCHSGLFCWDKAAHTPITVSELCSGSFKGVCTLNFDRNKNRWSFSFNVQEKPQVETSTEEHYVPGSK